MAMTLQKKRSDELHYPLLSNDIHFQATRRVRIEERSV